jgi:hypothetical protein
MIFVGYYIQTLLDYLHKFEGQNFNWDALLIGENHWIATIVLEV